MDGLTGYYHIQGLVLQDYATDSDVQYEEGCYIQYPVELVLSTNNADTYEIVSYTKMITILKLQKKMVLL